MTTNRHESLDRAARYAQHVAELCAAFGVHLLIGPMRPDAAGAGLVSDGSRCVMIAAVIDESTYAVAMHELGHCLSAFGMLHEHGSKSLRDKNAPSTIRDVLLKLEEERAAWEWAHHYALEWTDVMTFVERLGMSSYEDQARRILGKDYRG